MLNFFNQIIILRFGNLVSIVSCSNKEDYEFISEWGNWCEMLVHIFFVCGNQICLTCCNIHGGSELYLIISLFNIFFFLLAHDNYCKDLKRIEELSQKNKY